jgi:VIT1/CCC1 family predicted Fe2+/Mn2+ transporter
VLDPIERVSEIVFGVLMALSITGTLSVATAGREDIRTIMLMALGCNLAWGITDAVIYLVSVATERRRNATLLQRLHATQDEHEAHRLVAEALPERLAAAAGTQALEAMRKQLLATPVGPSGLNAQDFAGAFGVFLLVVASTFPVVIPFLFIDEPRTALRASNLLGLVTLFAGGWLLGRHAGGSPWQSGFGMAAIGTVLVVVIIALGG